MTAFERILEICLDQIASGESTIDQCLAQYPDHRQELAPLLRAAAQVASLRNIEPSPEFRQRGRRALDAHMRAKPRRVGKRGFFAQLFSGPAKPRRLATSLVAVALALVSTGTVLAQSALPGDPLYGWKLQSERVWRPFAGEKTQYELNLTDRRVHEYIAVYQQTDLATGALEDYTASLLQLLTQLEMQPSEALMVYEGLLEQQKDLTEGGLTIPELDAVLRTLMPTDTADPESESNQGLPAGTDTEEIQDNAKGDDEGETSNNDSLSGQHDVLATAVPGLLQGVATAVAPILNP